MNDSLLRYVSSTSRNKLIVLRKPLANMMFHDIGRELAEALKVEQDLTHISLRVMDIIDSILSEMVQVDQSIGKYLAIRNLGILFEDDLKIDFEFFLSKYSGSNFLFILWDGEVENDTIYFLTKTRGKAINLKNISHIVA